MAGADIVAAFRDEQLAAVADAAPVTEAHGLRAGTS